MRYKYIILLLFISNSIAYAELIDPTRPPDNIASGAVLTSGWQLEAIVIGHEHSAAIINGQTVIINGEIEGNKLIDIQPYSVQLQGIDGKITLFLLDNSLTINKN